MKAELYIADSGGAKVYLPSVEEGIEWTTQRRSTPGKLTFRVVRDDKLKLEEGAAVQLRVDGKPVFFGFVFTQQRDKDQIIRVTAYDQLRYLNNKDTYVYENKTAADLLRMIAADFSLQVGEVEDTGFVIPSRVEDNTTLFDMIENALDLTLQNNRGMYILYDDFGKLALKNISSMVVGEPGAYFMIDEATGENFDYSSSIDKDVYDKIKLIYENEDSGVREVFIAQDSGHINQWGVLQYFDTLQKGENGQAKAEALLKLYNAKTRTLQITGALGDTRVRAGSMIVVNLDLGDIQLKNLMLCEKVTHKFKLDEHRMDVTLRGGEFIA